MKLVDTLLNTSEADCDLLRKNLTLGDDPELPRDIDFTLHAKTEERAQLICDFVTDNHYGRPSYQRFDHDDGSVLWTLSIVIHSPTTEHVICTLSAFMACLAQLYDLDYDGWGSVIRKSA